MKREILNWSVCVFIFEQRKIFTFLLLTLVQRFQKKTVACLKKLSSLSPLQRRHLEDWGKDS